MPAKFICVAKPGRIDLRSPAALMKEMNLLLASLRRVELRIEPQSITDFLKWKNRMAEYNGGELPEGVDADGAGKQFTPAAAILSERTLEM